MVVVLVLCVSANLIYLSHTLLQFVNDGPVSTPTKPTRDVTKSIILRFFHEGEKENDWICELCPNGKVIRNHNNSTFNLLRHMRRRHENELKMFTEQIQKY